MARENSPRRGRNAADTAAGAAEVRTEVRLPSESVQFYIAGDILAGYVFVNKRVPLVVTGVTADNFEAVRARLSDLYGDHKTVCTASSEGGVRDALAAPSRRLRIPALRRKETDRAEKVRFFRSRGDHDGVARRGRLRMGPRADA